jgi:hypothetical protein
LRLSRRRRTGCDREQSSHRSDDERKFGHRCFPKFRPCRDPNLVLRQGKRFAVSRCGIPHLAKNERDVGHPGFSVRTKSKFESSFLNFVVGCPMSRSFFARCGIPRRHTANPPGLQYPLVLPYS